MEQVVAEGKDRNRKQKHGVNDGMEETEREARGEEQS